MDTPEVTEVVNTALLMRGAITAGVVLVVAVLLLTVKATIRQFAHARQIHVLRGRFVYRVVRFFTLVFAVFVLAYVWGFDPENLWVFITGVVGLIAIGFFAVWSLLSNIVAGLFLFLSDPFKISDDIEVVDGELSGRVLDIRPLFVVIREESGHTLFLPNSLLFQKAFRRLDPEARAREKAEAEAAEEAPAGAD